MDAGGSQSSEGSGGARERPSGETTLSCEEPSSYLVDRTRELLEDVAGQVCNGSW